jgi:uncharacterized protein DUF6702
VVNLRRSVVAILLIAAFPVRHPIHTTFTEIVARADTATVTVRAFSDDLAAALGAEGAADDSALARYGRARLLVAAPSGRAAPLVYIGRRVVGNLTFLTYRAVLPGGLGGARIRNAFHLELYRDQVNVVQVQRGAEVETVLFSGEAPPRALTGSPR